MGVDLADWLCDRWEAARAAWPGVEVPEAVFADHVRSRLEGSAPEALDTIDLYLACGYLRGCPGALAIFEGAILVHVAAWTRRFDASPAFADEVAQLLREKLLVASGGAPARIAAYAGRGALAAWVRVAAIRTALNLARDRRGERERELDDGEAVLDLGDPEPSSTTRNRSVTGYSRTSSYDQPRSSPLPVNADIELHKTGP